MNSNTSKLLWCLIHLLMLMITLGANNLFHVGRKIKACCPLGSTIKNDNQDFFSSKNYKCLSHASLFENENSSFYFNTFSIEGISIDFENFSLPKCKTQVAFKLLGEIKLTTQSCLTKFSNNFYAISCQSKNKDIHTKITVIRKCCPVNHVYCSDKQKCMVVEPSMNAYQQHMPNSVVLIDEPLTCMKDTVIVDYTLKPDEVTFSKENLMIKNNNKEFGFDEFCVEMNLFSNNKSNIKFIIRTCNPIKICEYIPCVRRCCSMGETYIRNEKKSICTSLTSTTNHFESCESLKFDGNFTKPRVFGIINGLDCQKYKLETRSHFTDEEHTINPIDGTLFIPRKKKMYFNTEYCVEKISQNFSTSSEMLYTFICFEGVSNDKLKFSLYSIGLLVSCCFYAFTLLTYLFISKLRNLPGKIIICLVGSLLSAYFGIAIGQILPPNDKICPFFAFYIYFSLIAAFAWMNVMSYDLWQTLSTIQRPLHLKDAQVKIFFLYSLYGWGLPTFCTVVIVTFTNSTLLTENIRPKFGRGRCWFEHTLADSQLIFLLGPIVILFSINLVFFCFTFHYCNKIKQDIFQLQNEDRRKRFFIDKARLSMNIKLFVAMGVTWFVEIISTIFYDRSKTLIWIMSDSFNVLLGIFVFFIFVYKKTILNQMCGSFSSRKKDETSNIRLTASTKQTCSQSICEDKV